MMSVNVSVPLVTLPVSGLTLSTKVVELVIDCTVAFAGMFVPETYIPTARLAVLSIVMF